MCQLIAEYLSPVEVNEATLAVDAIAEVQPGGHFKRHLYRAHVRLSWPAVADATQYRVYRSATPDPAGFVLLGETAALYYEDAGEGGTLNAYYYLVKGVNACGQEGP